MSAAIIGQPVSRVDGRQKVTGGATYAAEFNVPNLAHGASYAARSPKVASLQSTARLPNAHRA